MSPAIRLRRSVAPALLLVVMTGGARADEPGSYDRQEIELIRIDGSQGFFDFLDYGPSPTWKVARGRARESTSYEDFFAIVGRPDLADAYTHRRAVRRALFWTGIAFEPLGLGGLALAEARGGTSRKPLRIAGFGSLGVGFAAIWISFAFTGPPIHEEEAGGLVDGFNKRLRERLGGSSTRGLWPSLAWAPLVDRGTAGVACAGRF